MKKFEVRENVDFDAGTTRRDIYVDGELFEYEVDKNVLIEAQKLGPQYMVIVAEELQRHFLTSLSEFVGRPVTQEDVLKARQAGMI